VDHITARRRFANLADADDDSNLRGLCRSHHSSKTVRVDGGFTGAVRNFGPSSSGERLLFVSERRREITNGPEIAEVGL
jgi:5-methylcytosine-specific restriction endonuclease McrA